MTELPINIRPGTKDDRAFIVDSWTRSFSDAWFIHELGLSEWLASKCYSYLLDQRFSSFQSLIACNPEDETQIFGYLVYEYHQPTTCIHFIYVKDYLRSEGIAKRLLKALDYVPPYLTFSYFGCGRIAHHLLPQATFNPFHFLGIYIQDPKEKRYDTSKESLSISGN